MVMQKLIVILFHQQLILRYGSWALRTTETQPPSPSLTTSQSTIFTIHNDDYKFDNPNESITNINITSTSTITPIILNANHDDDDIDNHYEFDKHFNEEKMQQTFENKFKLDIQNTATTTTTTTTTTAAPTILYINNLSSVKEQKSMPPNYSSSSLQQSQTNIKKTTSKTTTKRSATTHHYHPPLGKIMKINSIVTNCTRDLFQINADLTKKFRGIFFAKDFIQECRTVGNYSTFVTLQLPTSGCGVRSVPKNDGSLEYSVKVMLQMDEKLRQSSDILKIVKCTVPASMMTMDVSDEQYYDDIDDDMKKIYRNGRMRLSSTNHNLHHHHHNQHHYKTISNLNSTGTIIDDTTTDTTSSSTSSQSIPRVRIWLELGANNNNNMNYINGDSNIDSGAVQVGQATTLAIRAVLPGTIGVRIIDCAALDGLGDSSQQLLDERGCPVDEQVMPALQIRITPAEEGWSKPHPNDVVEKLFTATFPAFKFPDRERLHVSCGVQLCKGSCPSVNCNTDEELLLTQEKQLARIEVFNSLAVTAPQIEIDRYRQYDKRYNMSAEEHPPRVRTLHSEGTLCLSISNLALAFCVLGLIFLFAVIVAVCCLIKSRTSFKSNNSQRAASTSAFSSSSDSAQSTRGTTSKLLIPYYAGTLPYGRVY